MVEFPIARRFIAVDAGINPFSFDYYTHVGLSLKIALLCDFARTRVCICPFPDEYKYS